MADQRIEALGRQIAALRDRYPEHSEIHDLLADAAADSVTWKRHVDDCGWLDADQVAGTIDDLLHRATLRDSSLQHVVQQLRGELDDLRVHFSAAGPTP